MIPKRLLLAVVLMGLVLAYFGFDLGRFLSLDYLKKQQLALEAWRATQPLTAAFVFFTTYVIVTALSLPGATGMSLVIGAEFGLPLGLLLVSFASSLGATLAFLTSRYLLRDWVQQHFGERLRTINAGMEKDGGFYLFTLRLVPIFPFFMVNLLMGLTTIKTRTYYVISQLGMLAGTVVYVNAGTQIARIDSLADIVSPALLCSFILLGLFPLMARKLFNVIAARKVHAHWTKPARFERDLIVIGGGAAGLVTAYIAATAKAKVTLIEKHKLGGDCLNTGCVPSKTLIQAARRLTHLRHSKEFGLGETQAKLDFAELMEHVQQTIQAIEPHDSIERYTALGVEIVEGTAKLRSPWEVDIVRNDGRNERLSVRRIVIATGAHPFIPPIPGIEASGYLTSDTIWNLRELPRRLTILGGGTIGTELAQAFARLGAKITLIEMAPRLLMREDPEVSELVAERFRAEGIDLRLNHRAVRFDCEGNEKRLTVENDGKEVGIPFDVVLVAVGRVANLKDYGLEELGIRINSTIETNEFLQTSLPSIYAVGDVTGPFQLTNAAAHQAWHAAFNSLFSPFWKFRVDTSAIPWATFVDPEIARVGLNEIDARRQRIPYEVTRYEIADLDRAIIANEAHGFIKLLTVPGKDRVLGVTIVGQHASELIAEYVLAMRCDIGLNKILGTPHIYPTMAEANKHAAGQWKKMHTPKKLFEWLSRYHRWRQSL